MPVKEKRENQPFEISTLISVGSGAIFFLLVFVGILLAVIGNYMPKCRLNYTMGIRTPWTLSSEENWNKTHRLGGKIWVAAGILIAASGFLALVSDAAAQAAFVIMMAVVIAAALVPVGYSRYLYQKSKRE